VLKSNKEREISHIILSWRRASAVLLFYLLAQHAFALAAKPVSLEHNIKPVPESEALITLYVNGVRYGDINCRIDTDNPFLNVDSLKKYLKDYLSSGQYESIFSIILSKLQWAGFDDLAAANLVGKFNLPDLTYHLEVPAVYSVKQDIDFTPSTRISETPRFKPSFISGVLNLTTNAQMSIAGGAVSLPVGVTADASMKIWDILLQGTGNFSYNSPGYALSYGLTYGTYDIPALKGRLLFGDVVGAGMSVQSRPEIWGISFQNQDIFRSYSRVYSPSVAFTLQRPSVVRIVVNGTVLRTVSLDSGNYRLFDLPFTYGLNNFQLEIQETDSTGKTVYKTIQTYIAAETGLLLGGESEYGLTAGFGKNEPTEPFASGYFRYGLTFALTPSLFFQTDARSLMGGTSLLWATNIGSFLLEGAGVDAWDGRAYPITGFGSMRYQLTVPVVPWLPNVGITFSYSSRGFQAPFPSSLVVVPDEQLSVSANAGNIVNKRLSYGFTAYYIKYLTGLIFDSLNLSFNLNYNIDNFKSISLASGMQFQNGSPSQYNLSMALTLAGPRGSNERASFTQSADGTNDVAYSNRLPDWLGGMYYTLDGTNLLGGVASQSSVSMNSFYAGQFFNLSGNMGINYGGTAGAVSGTVNLTGATGLAFAGGVFALTSPVLDSFVIFAPDKSAADLAMSVSVGGIPQNVSAGLPIVRPLSSYNTVIATVDFPEASTDIMPKVSHSVLPTTYKSGILFQVSAQKLYILKGKLMNSTGKPVTYIGGQVKNEKGEIVDTTFTDDTGSFQTYGLLPGDYVIDWSPVIGIIKVQVRDTPSGILDIGNVTPVLTPAGGGS
jgi:outer membrane usher protein